jgi:hypothetical protein
VSSWLHVARKGFRLQALGFSLIQDMPAQHISNIFRPSSPEGGNSSSFTSDVEVPRPVTASGERKQVVAARREKTTFELFV